MPPYLAVQHLRDDLYVTATIPVNIVLDSPVMREDVFGQIPPVLEIVAVERSIYVS